MAETATGLAGTAMAAGSPIADIAVTPFTIRE
jgi:hypothetical protein